MCGNRDALVPTMDVLSLWGILRRSQVLSVELTTCKVDPSSASVAKRTNDFRGHRESSVGLLDLARLQDRKRFPKAAGGDPRSPRKVANVADVAQFVKPARPVVAHDEEVNPVFNYVGPLLAPTTFRNHFVHEPDCTHDFSTVLKWNHCPLPFFGVELVGGHGNHDFVSKFCDSAQQLKMAVVEQVERPVRDCSPVSVNMGSCHEPIIERE